SAAQKPPTETQSGTSSARRRGSVSVRKRSRPGFARPIAFSIPCAVSAIRGGAFPSRGSGVIVFVTNASSCRATCGAASASRQPEALSSRGKDRPLHAESLELPVDLDRAAVAGAVPARHRRLPCEHVEPLQVACCYKDGVDDHLGAGKERGRLGVRVRPEAEDGGREPERLGEIRERRDADAAADEERSRDVEPEAVAERSEDVDALTRLERAERRRPGTDRVDEERELAGRGETERERTRQQPPRRLEHEELTGRARLDRAALEPEERVLADALAAGDAEPLASRRHRRPPPRSAPAARARTPCVPTRSRARRRRRRRAS